MSLAMLFLMLLAAGPVSPKAPVSIGGVVVMATTNAPVADTLVSIYPLTNKALSQFEGLPRPVTTDKNGRFNFEKVPPGNYGVDIERASSNLMVKVSDSSSFLRGIQVVTANAGENTSNLRIEVVPASSISGRILDRKGKPLENIAVTATSPNYANGFRKIGNIVGGAKTNRRGEYRIVGLLPGQYYVGVNVSRIGLGLTGLSLCASSPQSVYGGVGGRGIIDGPMMLNSLGMPGFYPGVRNVADAMPIDLHLSAEAGNINFKVDDPQDAQAPSTLHGTVIDATTEKRATDAEVWITPLDQRPGSCLLEADKGSFEISGLLPGKYAVSANLEMPARMAGRVVIDTTEKPLKNVTIPVKPLFHIRGRVVLEGAAADSNSSLDLSRLFVNLQPDPVVNSARLSFAAVARDGTFDIQGLSAWDYRVNLRSPEPNTYIQSIRFGTTDVLRDGLSLENQSASELEIVIRKDAGAVSGVAAMAAIKGMAGTQKVVLVPDSSLRYRLDLFRSVEPNEKGEFELSGLPPGSYHMFAWENVNDGAWTDPQFMRLFENQGTAVRIAAGETSSVRLNPAAPWK